MDLICRDYEAVIIFSPVLNDKENNDIYNKITKLITDNKGEIIESSVIGIKKMAYKIKKFENGYYIYLQFKAIPSLIKDLEILFKRDERIIRFLVCNLSKEGVKYNEIRRSNKENIINIIETNIQ